MKDNGTKMSSASFVVHASLYWTSHLWRHLCEAEAWIVFRLLPPAGVCVGLTYSASYIVLFALFLLNCLLRGKSGSPSILFSLSFSQEHKRNHSVGTMSLQVSLQFICPVYIYLTYTISHLYSSTFVIHSEDILIYVTPKGFQERS